MSELSRYAAVSRGMSRAFKARSRACPICGRKTIQPKRRNYWEPGGHVCRWARLHPPTPTPGEREGET